VKNVLEVLPNPENRVMLSAQKDAFGILTPKISYSFDNYALKGMQVAAEHYRRIASIMGGTNLRPSKEGQYENNQHITGTMSMGDDPKISVVDPFGRAHDHENLFVVSTGVMPTAATCNSTLTALALGLRSAQHLRETA
jgi:choline dehydrogenase-like flavoprotein